MTFMAAFNLLDRFAWVGSFSGGFTLFPGVAVAIPPPANADRMRGPDITRTIDPARFAACLPQLNASANQQLRLLYVAVGTEDGLFSAHQSVKAVLKNKGVSATLVETPGYGHEWSYWRLCLRDFAPRLFQAGTR
jgi:enterochelin esterase family protein